MYINVFFIEFKTVSDMVLITPKTDIDSLESPFKDIKLGIFIQHASININ